MFLSQEKRRAILEKTKVNLVKKIFRTQKLFENAWRIDEAWNNYQITLSSIGQSIKKLRFVVQSITLQMLNIIMGLGHRMLLPLLKEKTIRLAQAQDRLRSSWKKTFILDNKQSILK